MMKLIIKFQNRLLIEKKNVEKYANAYVEFHNQKLCYFFLEMNHGGKLICSFKTANV